MLVRMAVEVKTKCEVPESSIDLAGSSSVHSLLYHAKIPILSRNIFPFMFQTTVVHLSLTRKNVGLAEGVGSEVQRRAGERGQIKNFGSVRVGGENTTLPSLQQLLLLVIN